MSPNNFVLLDSDKCDHLYLLVAAILSNENLKKEFKLHIELLGDMYDTTNESILEENFLITEDFIKFSENILNDMELSTDYLDCIFDMNDTISSTINNSNSIDMENLNTLAIDSNQCSNIYPESYPSNISDNFTLYNDCKNNLIDKIDNELNQPMCDIAFSNQPIFANDHHDLSVIKEKKSNSYNIAQDKRITEKRKRYTLRKNNSDDHNDDPSVTIKKVLNLMAFEYWLSSVIERINLTMDYNHNGKPDKLIFSISKVSKIILFFYEIHY